MLVLIEMINPIGVERGGSAIDAMYGVALIEEQFSKIGAVLAGDTADQSHTLAHDDRSQSLNLMITEVGGGGEGGKGKGGGVCGVPNRMRKRGGGIVVAGSGAVVALGRYGGSGVSHDRSTLTYCRPLAAVRSRSTGAIVREHGGHGENRLLHIRIQLYGRGRACSSWPERFATHARMLRRCCLKNRLDGRWFEICETCVRLIVC